MSDDEPIGKGSTTLDYLRVRHKWLGVLIDEADAELATLRERVKALEEGIRKLYDGCLGCTQTPNLALRCWNCRQYEALLAQPPAGGANDE